jgi:hypothetical protein
LHFRNIRILAEFMVFPWFSHGFHQATASAAGKVGHFLAAPNGFAVVGASAERQKFGNKAQRWRWRHGVYPLVN